jgi:putative tricarboxylic transport membrane protein
MEMIFNTVVGIFILGYLGCALILDKNSVAGDVFGAGGFPIVLSIIGLITLVLISTKTLRKKTKVHIPMFNLKSQAGETLAVNIAILTAYVFLMDVIGFILSTLLFLFGSARSMGYKQIPILLFYTVVLAVILVFSFGKVFFVPLPRGIGFFRELSYFFY